MFGPMGPPWGPQDLGHNICFQLIQKFSKSKLCLFMRKSMFAIFLEYFKDGYFQVVGSSSSEKFSIYVKVKIMLLLTRSPVTSAMVSAGVSFVLELLLIESCLTGL